MIPFFHRWALTGFILVTSNFYLYDPIIDFELFLVLNLFRVSGDEYAIGTWIGSFLNAIFLSVYKINLKRLIFSLCFN